WTSAAVNPDGPRGTGIPRLCPTDSRRGWRSFFSQPFLVRQTGVVELRANAAGRPFPRISPSHSAAWIRCAGRRPRGQKGRARPAAEGPEGRTGSRAYPYWYVICTDFVGPTAGRDKARRRTPLLSWRKGE